MKTMCLWFAMLCLCALKAGIALGMGEPAGGWLVAIVACALASYKDYNRLFVSPEL